MTAAALILATLAGLWAARRVESGFKAKNAESYEERQRRTGVAFCAAAGTFFAVFALTALVLAWLH